MSNPCDEDRLALLASELENTRRKYERAVWFLQDIAAMGRTKGCETAAHALAQLKEPRERDGE